MAMPRTTPQLGRYGPPVRTIAHLSDPHLLAEGAPLYGSLAQEATLDRALAQLAGSDAAPDALVVTGDLTDLGQPDAYRRLRDIVEPVAARLGAELVWVPGNHDERGPMREHLLGAAPDDAPIDRVHDLGGLRLIALDTSVPGYHHGDLDAGQLAWLRDVLAEPAPLGSVLALHHPPLPTPVGLMQILELQHQDELADVVAGSDVRVILGGHLHHKTHGSFAGVPVSVASATCYTMDTSAPSDRLRGVDGGWSYDIVEFHADGGVLHTTVPVGPFPQVSGFTAEQFAELAALDPAERLELFSRKR
jgi:3',5'-cyclic-AMP phosphodiesterase